MSLITLLSLICAQFCPHGTPKPRPPHVEIPSLPASRHSSDTRDLIHLSQTCHGLHPIAGPFIYHEFTISHWRSFEVVDFLRNIRLPPDLASCVHHLTINAHPSSFVVDYASFIHKEAIRHAMLLLDDWLPPFDVSNDQENDSKDDEDWFWNLGPAEKDKHIRQLERAFIDLVLSMAPKVE
jgi:hypothetical protein